MPTNKQSIAVVSRLLESELSFHNRLTNGDAMLCIYGNSKIPDAEVYGTLDIWWEAEVDTRNWGIKGLDINITKLELTGGYLILDERGRDKDSGETFSYTYPPAASTEPLGDLSEPTEAYVNYLATPDWKVDWELEDRHDWSVRPEATVDVAARTIQITF